MDPNEDIFNNFHLGLYPSFILHISQNWMHAIGNDTNAGNASFSDNPIMDARP